MPSQVFHALRELDPKAAEAYERLKFVEVEIRESESFKRGRPHPLTVVNLEQSAKHQAEIKDATAALGAALSESIGKRAALEASQPSTAEASLQIMNVLGGEKAAHYYQALVKEHSKKDFSSARATELLALMVVRSASGNISSALQVDAKMTVLLRGAKPVEPVEEVKKSWFSR